MKAPAGRLESDVAMANDDVDVAGELSFSDRALCEIACRAVREVGGVRGTAGDMMGGLIGRLSRGHTHRGIALTARPDGKRVFDLAIVVIYGSNVYAVGAEVRRLVAERIAAMTGIEPIVNVRVKAIE